MAATPSGLIGHRPYCQHMIRPGWRQDRPHHPPSAYLGEQAYEELRADGHPVVVMAARDIVELLRDRGYATPDAVRAWLATEFPRGEP